MIIRQVEQTHCCLLGTCPTKIVKIKRKNHVYCFSKPLFAAINSPWFNAFNIASLVGGLIEQFQYGRAITTTTNVSTAVCLIVPYVLTLYAVHKMTQIPLSLSAEQSQARRMEQRMLIQVMVVCSLTATCCVFYPISPLFTNSVTFFQILHFIWIFSHGNLQTLIHLLVNAERRCHSFA